MNIHNECTSDCKDVSKTSSTVNTPGFHEVAGVCKDDKTVPAINTECIPKQDGKSINQVWKMCEPDCLTGKTPVPVKASHWFNQLCLPDANIANKKCTQDTPGKTVNLLGECIADCKDATDSSKTLSVPQFHDLSGTCTADVPDPDSPTENNQCTPP